MSPRRRHHLHTLEELSLRVVFESVVADLNLAHLLASDLRHSTLLAPLRLSSPDTLRQSVATRLANLPGIMNDQVRHRLIQRLFSVAHPDRWLNAKLDVLKVLVDKSITTLDCRQQALPRQVLEVVAIACPALTSLKVVIEQESTGGGAEWKGDSQPDPKTPSVCSHPSPRTARRKASHNLPCLTTTPSHECLAGLTRLTTLHLTNGATNEVLAALGESIPGLRELRVCYSFAVTDAGLTALCLRGASMPWPLVPRGLYWLDLLPSHFNRCCSVLEEVDILGTRVSHFGLAFLLRHLPALRSLGHSPLVTSAIELLVSWRPAPSGTFTTRLRKLRDDDVSGPRLMTIALHCPDLRDMSLTHTFQEADLTSRHSHITGHVANLKHLKKVQEFTVRLAPKLTIDSARVLVRGCSRLQHLKDLGGWDVTVEEYSQFLQEIKRENYDAHVTYTSRRAASEHEPQERTIWDLDPLHRFDRMALRRSLGNLLPLVVL
ncbi:hypothetical protein E2C01_014365 [Portunus trituberculatus]|uniref:Uncharacterized protein n=1 Tax=Portunus trituberculatus TaxID=210409 RepID=A0A5B7DIL7_PORTR|nr:hypothetical protein [Portunus trituberculatus]